MPTKRSKKIKRAADAVVDNGAFAIGSVVRLVMRAVLTVLFVVIVTGLLFTCVFAYYVKNSLSSEMDVTLEDIALSEASTIWCKDANGEYQELVTLKSANYFVWVDFEDIPQHMIDAVIAIEDKRFYEHKGVDWYRTAGAFSKMFLSMSNTFGGSTLTQQLIKNVTLDKDVTVQRKLLEIFRALEFEKTYTKEEIVLWYLNVAYFGWGESGVAVAAEEFFGKEVRDLTLAESACIVAITNNPSIYSPYASEAKNKERQELIIYEMYDQGYISYNDYLEAKNEKLNFARGVDEEYEDVIYSWYVEALIDEAVDDIAKSKDVSEKIARHLLYNGGLQIYACVDLGIQAIVDDVYGVDDGDMSKLPKSWSGSAQQFQSACVILDPHNGDIAALVGGTGQKTVRFGLNRATEARRQPGSSFKPIASYGPAFELGLITQTTIVNDSPGIKLKGISNWYPKNSGGYSGPITIRSALIASKNTVAAQIIDKLTVSESYKFLTERLGVQLDPLDEAYAPLALGGLTVGVTVKEMAQAFGSFVNDGVFTYARTYSHINNSDGSLFMDNTSERINAFSPNTAYNIADMLKAAVAGGTGTDARFYSTDVGGKTGTTESNKDRYFVGFTSYYVCAVWTGYDKPEVMNFSGNPAAKIFRTLMVPIHEGLEYKSFPAPTIGGPTKVFGDMAVGEASESPSESLEPEESPTESPTEEVPPPTPTGGTPTPTGGTPPPTGGTPTPTGNTPTPTTSVAPTPTTPVSQQPTTPVTQAPPDPIETQPLTEP